jgi:hypothetical protein
MALSLKCMLYGDSPHVPCTEVDDQGKPRKPCDHWCHDPERSEPLNGDASIRVRKILGLPCRPYGTV